MWPCASSATDPGAVRATLSGLIFAAVISGVASLGDVRKLGRLGGITVAYYLCTQDQVSLPAQQLAVAVRSHWMVEAWHWLRDVTLGEDDHLARSGHIATNLAALRNTVISLLHLAGTSQIARTLRRLARNPEHAISLLTSTKPTLN